MPENSPLTNGIIGFVNLIRPQVDEKLLNPLKPSNFCLYWMWNTSLNGFGDEFIGLIIAVDTKHAGYDQEETVVAENCFELVRCIDGSSHTISQNASVLSVQSQRTIDDIDKKMNIRGVSKVPCHCFKHSRNQAYPIELVQYIKAQKFLKSKGKNKGKYLFENLEIIPPQ